MTLLNRTDSYLLGIARLMITRRPSFGFTLIEITLVLAILVMVGALISPAVSAILSYQRLSHGADQVRVQLMQARLEAMRSGRPQVLQCTINSSTITLRPWIDPSAATDAADMAGTVQAGAMVAATPVNNHSGNSVELVEGIVCESVHVVSDSRACAIVSAVAANPTAAETEEGATATPALPVIFYPDGTSSDAMITVTGSSGKRQLLLRGLTGDVIQLKENE